MENNNKLTETKEKTFDEYINELIYLQQFIGKKIETYNELLLAQKMRDLIEKPISQQPKKLKILLVGFNRKDLPFEDKFDPNKGVKFFVTPKGVEIVNWYKFMKTTLYDYNVILIDLSTLSNITEAIKHKTHIEKFLEAGEGGLLIVITSQKKLDITRRYSNYDLFPVKNHLFRINVKNEGSKEYDLGIPGPYKKILNFYNGQGFCFEGPFPENYLPVALSRVGNPLSIQYWYGKGRIVLLPYVSSKKDVISILLFDILPDITGVVVPEWINNYLFTDENKLKEQINAIQNKLNGYSKWKILLYGTGFQLTQIVYATLIQIGLNVKQTEAQGEHDLEIKFDEKNVGIVEVTGSSGRIYVEKLSQLLRFCDVVEKERTDNNIKGILIANSERKKGPSTRSDPFDRKVIDVATTLNLTLMTTYDLYQLLQMYLSNSITKQELIDMIRYTKGVLNLTTK